ncbi:MAG: hypothetical protein HY939_04190 [Gammaproteobacteria bacterium]|nr:hypothetical protein [Gammaproteobacteria bacterium]
MGRERKGVVVPERKPGYAHLPSDRVSSAKSDQGESDLSSVDKSSHAVRRGFVLPKKKLILSKESGGKPAYIKPYTSDQERELLIKDSQGKSRKKAMNMPQFESAMCDFFRLYLGPSRAPKSRVIQKKKGEESSEVVSRQVEGYTPFYRENIFPGKWDDCEYMNLQRIEERKKRLLEGKFFEALAANYVMEESDCHDANIGFNHQGEVSVIDKDRAWGSLTGVGKFSRHGKKGEVIDVVYVVPECYSQVTGRDIMCLLDTENFRPIHAPLRGYRGFSHLEKNFVSSQLGKELTALEEGDDQAVIQKYTVLLMSTLLTKEMIKKMLSAHIVDEEWVDFLSNEMYERNQSIKEVLMNSPDFKRVFDRYGAKITREIEKKFDDYNEEMKKYPEKMIVLTPGEIVTNVSSSGKIFLQEERELFFENLKNFILSNDLVQGDEKTNAILKDAEFMVSSCVCLEEAKLLGAVFGGAISEMDAHLLALKSVKEEYKKTLAEKKLKVIKTHEDRKEIEFEKRVVMDFDREAKRVEAVMAAFQSLNFTLQKKMNLLPSGEVSESFKKRVESFSQALEKYLSKNHGLILGSERKTRREEKNRLALLLKKIVENPVLTEEKFDKALDTYSKASVVKKGTTLHRIINEAKKSH